jgi:hypothetical protein
MTPGAGAQKRKKEKMVLAHLDDEGHWAGQITRCITDPDFHKGDESRCLGLVKESDLDA